MAIDCLVTIDAFHLVAVGSDRAKVAKLHRARCVGAAAAATGIGGFGLFQSLEVLREERIVAPKRVFGKLPKLVEAKGRGGSGNSIGLLATRDQTIASGACDLGVRTVPSDLHR